MRDDVVDVGAGRLLVTAGLLLVAMGLLWPFIADAGLGSLPGDIVIERDGFRFYFPVTTMVLLSLTLSALLWLIRR